MRPRFGLAQAGLGVVPIQPGMWARMIVVVALGFYVSWLTFGYEYHFIDGVNLAFHEAGHLFLSWGGATLHFLGGTIGQLFFPIACAVHFLGREQSFEAAICGIWGAESLMNVARYLGDAEAQLLPLVGGHIHDWHWLLSRWGLLDRCEGIAAGLHVVASLLAIGFWLWCAREAWRPEPSEAWL